MGKTEEFIQEHTRNCYNYNSYAQTPEPWITPDQARRAVEIAKEELIDKAFKYINYQLNLPSDFEQHFRKAMENKL